MKIVKAVVFAAILASAIAPGLADARGGRHFGGGYRVAGFGLGIGLGLALSAPAYAYYGPRYYAPAYYAPPYYAPAYYPPAYYAPPAYAPDYGYAPAYPSPPPVASAPAPQAANVWYYCASSNGYYPYVRQCGEGWQQVAPTPQGR